MFIIETDKRGPGELADDIEKSLQKTNVIRRRGRKIEIAFALDVDGDTRERVLDGVRDLLGKELPAGAGLRELEIDERGIFASVAPYMVGPK